MMDEREMLIAMISDDVSTYISQLPTFQLLATWDLQKTNSDFLSGLPQLPEHAEQTIIDTTNITIDAMRDIISCLQDKYSEERIAKVLDIDKIIDDLLKDSE